MGRYRDGVIKAYEQKIAQIPYTFCHYKQFNYSLLKYIPYLYRGGRGDNDSWNNVIIMIDTETSKKKPDETYWERGKLKYKTGENHIVAWTISIRSYHHNICTLYGRKPSKMVETMHRIHEYMSGMKTVFYCHNLGFDYMFLRKFMYRQWGFPVNQLNVKPYYPVFIEFDNGIIIKDSLILSQRSLNKWASDLEVSDQKEIGLWDYEKLRNQDTPLSEDELKYIEHDTLAGVECLDKTMESLNKKIYSMPLTATGIPREKTRKLGKSNNAHDFFKRIALTLQQYKKFLLIFHGGYTHGNRHFINTLITGLVQCFDFVSSYPYIMLAFKFPMERFTSTDNCTASFILKNMNEYAYTFKFIATNIRLKSDREPMPALQFSKCVKTINAINDNGRILCASYVEIYLTEYDLAVINDMYIWDKHICTEVEFAKKDYLPRWYTDFVYESFKNKTECKAQDDYDATTYSILKSLVNCLYGMLVQKSLAPDIVEDYLTGEFLNKEIEDEEAEYLKYVDKVNSILPYQWGCYVTSIGFYNVHQLMKCCDPLYGDTDSCYGRNWDMDKVNLYNSKVKERLLKNNYGPVVINGKEFWLGVAESEGDKDKYTEFKYMGAKRYCGRCLKTGKLKLTVSGVPKGPGAECLNDDISNFTPGFIFDGTKTGKKTHMYFYVDDIYIDENGNETGDSVSLIPCDYELDAVEKLDWLKLFEEEVTIQTYDLSEY